MTVLAIMGCVTARRSLYREVIWLGPTESTRRFAWRRNRVNSNAVERSEPNRAKCPREVRGVQNDRSRRYTKN